MDALLFIDTNILLNFYQYCGGPDLPLLGHIDQNRGRIITSSEVEMEYKKNRQRVVSDYITTLKAFDLDVLAAPAFIAGSKAAITSERYRLQLKEQMERLVERAEAIMENPVKNDPVYQVLQRLFRHRGPYVLERDDDARHELRELAWQRFILGYPPRKRLDLNVADAINWEWLVRCARTSRKDVIIVSRDNDYGRNGTINDWLAQEFRDRVGRNRNVHLTGRLSTAFSMISIRVTKEEARKEDELIRSMQGEAA